MLEALDRIIDTTLVADLRGFDRWAWRRRIRAVQLCSAGLIARDNGLKGEVRYMIQSLCAWPSPFWKPRRFAMFAVSARNKLSGASKYCEEEEIVLKVTYYVDGDARNFGDDLNRWLWSRVLDFPLDVDDGTLVLGISTIISRSFIPFAKRYIVLSSGVGYDAPPQDFGCSKWKFVGSWPINGRHIRIATRKGDHRRRGPFATASRV